MHYKDRVILFSAAFKAAEQIGIDQQYLAAKLDLSITDLGWLRNYVLGDEKVICAKAAKLMTQQNLHLLLQIEKSGEPISKLIPPLSKPIARVLKLKAPVSKPITPNGINTVRHERAQLINSLEPGSTWVTVNLSGIDFFELDGGYDNTYRRSVISAAARGVNFINVFPDKSFYEGFFSSKEFPEQLSPVRPWLVRLRFLSQTIPFTALHLFHDAKKFDISTSRGFETRYCHVPALERVQFHSMSAKTTDENDATMRQFVLGQDIMYVLHVLHPHSKAVDISYADYCQTVIGSSSRLTTDVRGYWQLLKQTITEQKTPVDALSICSRWFKAQRHATPVK